MDEVNNMMEDHALPDGLRYDVCKYFAECEDLWKLADRQQKLVERMSPSLKNRVALAMSQEWIRKVPYIREIFLKQHEQSVAFIAEMARFLEARIFAAGEKLTEPALYIIRKGVLALGP